MGCFVARGPSEGNKVSRPIKKENSTVMKSQEVKSKDQFQISTADLITEKSGKITKDYTILNPALGKGAFGEVRKAIHKKSNLIRAIKIINKANTTKEEQDKLINEVEILKQLDHPNIIKIFEFYQDDRFFYIVTELCTGGELFDKIIELKNFSEKKAALVMRQLLSAVYYCHVHNIVHRDLKPENLLLESKAESALIKVIDFGTSRVFDANKKMHQKFGTPYYIAPEVLKKKYDEKCDIWSCGIILYIMLCGYPPFNGPNDNVIMHKVAKGMYDFNGDEWKQISNEAKNFIRKLLEYAPEKRYNAEQANADPWMRKWAQEDQVEVPLITRALENMRNFRAERKLQEATFVFLVNYLASKEEKAELLKTFRSLDTNGDGQLSRDELLQGYKKIMNAAQAEEEVEKIMKSVDRDNSGHIDYTEFVIATINRENLLSKQRLETVFSMFDKDGSGSVSIAELKEIFGGKDVSEEVWKELLKEVDDNGDGEISYPEFKDMMLKMLDDKKH